MSALLTEPHHPFCCPLCTVSGGVPVANLHLLFWLSLTRLSRA